MGLLDGKRILVTGVLTDDSLAFAAARSRRSKGPRSCSPGRVADGAHAARRPPTAVGARGVGARRDQRRPCRGGPRPARVEMGRRRRRTSRDRVRSGLVPRRRLPRGTVGGRISRAADLHVLAQGARRTGRTVDARRRLDRRARLRQQRAGVAGLRLDGRREGRARGDVAVPGEDPRPAGHPSEPRRRRPIRTVAAKSIPAFAQFEDVWSERAPLGWDVRADYEAVGRACVALLSDWFPKTTGEMIHVDGGFHAVGA